MNPISVMEEEFRSMYKEYRRRQSNDTEGIEPFESNIELVLYNGEDAYQIGTNEAISTNDEYKTMCVILLECTADDFIIDDDKGECYIDDDKHGRIEFVSRLYNQGHCIWEMTNLDYALIANVGC